MRKFKKSLAIVLAVAMVFSLFTCLGGLFVSAAATQTEITNDVTSTAKSNASNSANRKNCDYLSTGTNSFSITPTVSSDMGPSSTTYVKISSQNLAAKAPLVIQYRVTNIGSNNYAQVGLGVKGTSPSATFTIFAQSEQYTTTSDTVYELSAMLSGSTVGIYILVSGLNSTVEIVSVKGSLTNASYLASNTNPYLVQYKFDNGTNRYFYGQNGATSASAGGVTTWYDAQGNTVASVSADAVLYQSNPNAGGDPEDPEDPEETEMISAGGPLDYVKEVADNESGSSVNAFNSKSLWSLQYRRLTDTRSFWDGAASAVDNTTPWITYAPTGVVSRTVEQTQTLLTNKGIATNSAMGASGDYFLNHDLDLPLMMYHKDNTYSFLNVIPSRGLTDGVNWSLETALTFKPAVSGTYTFVPLGSEEQEGDSWWKPGAYPTVDGEHTVKFGVRFTVNGKMVWNNGCTTTAYAQFTNQSHLYMLKNKTFDLKAGDVFRVEIVCFESRDAYLDGVFTNFRMDLTAASGDTTVSNYPISAYCNDIKAVTSNGAAVPEAGNGNYTIGTVNSTSPWRVQTKNAGNWQDFTFAGGFACPEDGGTESGHFYVGYANAIAYPGFGFTLGSKKMINIISPNSDAAYSFTTPETGKYHFGADAINAVRSATENNFFRIISSSEHLFTLNATVNGETVYSGTFDYYHPLLIPELDLVLDQGDIFRLEFHSNDVLSSDPWLTRITGSFRMRLMERSTFGANAKTYRLGDMHRQIETVYQATAPSATNEQNTWEFRFFDPVVTSPWKVQMNDNWNNNGWEDFPLRHSSNEINYSQSLHYIDDKESGELAYPNIAYWAPTGSRYENVGYRGFISPVIYQEHHQDMAYTFTAPDSGTYGFGPSASDSQFILYENNTEEARGCDYGVRITVNGKTFWNGDNPQNGYCVFSAGNPVDIPTLLNFHLNEGDVLRVEFTVFGNPKYSYFNRTYGTVEIARMSLDGEKTTYANVADEIDSNAFAYSLYGGTWRSALFSFAKSDWSVDYRSTATNLEWQQMKIFDNNNVRNFYAQEADTSDVWTGPTATNDYAAQGYVLYARKTSSADAKERAALTFTAPADATYSVTCPIIQKYGAGTKVNIVVTRNGSQVWPTDGTTKQLTANSETVSFDAFNITLQQGEIIRFESWSEDSESSTAGVFVNPSITEVGEATEYYYGTSVSLLPESGNNSLGMNFYYKTSNESKQLYCDIAGVETALSGITQGDNLLRYQLPLSSTQMAKHVTVYFKNGDVKEEIVGGSIQEYAEKILSHETSEDYSEELKKAVTALLEYGRIAQIYFRVDSTCAHPGYAICPGDNDPSEHIGTYPDVNLEDCATKAGDPSYRTNKGNINVWSVGNSQYNAAVDGKINVQVTPDSAKGQQGSESVYLYGTSLVLQSSISLKVYLQGDVAGKTVQVSSPGMIENVDYSVSAPTVYSASKSIYCVEISGLCPAKLDAIFNIKVKNGGTTLTVSDGLNVSALGYVSRVLDTYDDGVGGHGVSNNLRDLLLRLTNLYLNSKTYFEAIYNNQGMDDWEPLG
ncbi:MAG: hypothetical protein IKI29_03820 [Clostridia bacterium]|nr:hypothetical protein [Clostridia bacterium]